MGDHLRATKDLEHAYRNIDLGYCWPNEKPNGDRRQHGQAVAAVLDGLCFYDKRKATYLEMGLWIYFFDGTRAEMDIYCKLCTYCTYDFQQKILMDDAWLELAAQQDANFERITMSPAWNANFTNCLPSVLPRGKLPPLLATRETYSFPLVDLILPRRMRTDTAIPHSPSSNQLDSAVRWPSGLRR
jgi:hypothetical protein